MNSSTILTFLVSLCVVAAVIETNYEVFTKQELIDKFSLHDGNFQAHSAINLGYPEDCNSSIIPPDNGSGSYGDLMYSRREYRDELLHRETFVNYNVSNHEDIVFWYGNFSTRCVTHVRSLNFGRERAWTKSIHVGNNNTYNTVEINVLVPVNKTVRMFFEIYGHQYRC